MKKICIFNSYYPILKGGAEYQAKLLAEKLSEHSDVFYISYGHKKDEIIIDHKFKIYCLAVNKYFDTFSFYQYSAKKIEVILKKEKPDIIYQRILNSYSLHIGNIAQKIKSHLFIHIADNYCLEFGTSFRSQIRYVFFRKIKKLYRHNTISFITQTRYQTSVLNTFTIKPILQIYNLHPKPEKIESVRNRFNSKKIVWIGSTRRVKNFELFLNIVQEFRKSELSFIMIGRFEDNKYGRLLKQKAQLLNNLECIGEIENKDVNNILSSCMFLVNTSYSEGFSNTFIQAWLRGIPVLSYAVDSDNLIEREKLGYCSNQNFDDFKKKIDSFVLDYERYEDTSKRCVTFSKKNFIIDNKVQLIERIFNN